MTPDASRSRVPRRRRVSVVVALAAAFAVLYVVVVALYAVNDRTVTVTGCTETPPSDAILMSLTPESVDAVGDRITANLDVVSLGPVASGDTGLLSDPLTVVVTDTDGPRSYEMAADAIPSPLSLRFITDGFVERWPFDRHSVQFAIVSLQQVETAPSAIPTRLCGSAHVPGWTFESANVEGTDELVIDGEPVTQVRVTASRSPATIAFGIVILVLMVALPVLALTVAVLALRGARKVEATLTSWMAAMLFATIPLRTFLPGSPPIGSWVDYLVVLWVVAGLVAALAIYVAAWIRWAPRGGAPVAVTAAVPLPVALPVRDPSAAADGGGGAADD